MNTANDVEIADRMSRRRAIVVGLAAVAFIAFQFVDNPFFIVSDPGTQRAVIRRVLWAAYTGALLLGLATGGGLLDRRVRVLVDDEVSRGHYRTASTAGFWIAMATGMLIYLYGGYDLYTGQQAIYLVVTPAVAAALLVFAYLEMRALRSG
ncbi:MAG: hypothetical protein AB1941_07890 [Gemmatimonadota bacterium]